MAASSSSSNIRLVTNTRCPFAQKAWIALRVKQVELEIDEISLYGPNGKPDWFWNLNPQGTVPVLVVSSSSKNDKKKTSVVTDSDDILNELDDIVGNTNGQNNILLYPSDIAVEEIETWRQERINQKLLPLGQQAVLAHQLTPPLQSVLQEMDRAVVGPFLLGSHVTAADCHAFPFVW
eukprot:CAMPEP_0172439512 /NCGR_PEP_ID=MMETSP1065-20121228/476_1 /TAXON_ID=265537 /ORGANISM="Amphiprora paludosa, Strain CCMP125" /LENGTH=177 /DNA_ID=CAMNT_0013188203 /DNA_START=160 /DNA_END=690 /DNA_ORIENTATION=-